MGLFGKKDSISRIEMRSAFRKTPITKVGTGGKKYTQKERMALEKEVFSGKYGGEISKKDYNSALEKMRRTKSEKSYSERMEIQRKIDSLKKFGFGE